MSDETITENNQCGKCKFWFPEPRDIANLKAELHGQCRFSPPQMTAIFRGNSIGQYVSYPIIKQSYMACSQFKISLMVIN